VANCRQTTLFSIVSDYYLQFIREIEQSGDFLPRFVHQEFEAYLKCGMLEHGFLRAKCDGCRHEHLVAFSCKRRGFCTFLVRRAGFTVASGARTGAVTLIQRFGSALNLNIHLHMLFLDGTYKFTGQGATFHRARSSNTAELTTLLDTLSRRIVRLLERQGLLVADLEYPALDFAPGSSLDQLQAASISYRIANGVHKTACS